MEMSEKYNVSKKALEYAKFFAYSKYGIMLEEGKPIPENIINLAQQIDKAKEKMENEVAAKQNFNRIKNNALEEYNLKKIDEATVKYEPEEKRCSKNDLKIRILKIVCTLLASGIVLGGVGVGLYENAIENKAESIIVQSYPNWEVGKTYDRGIYWLESEKYVEAIIDAETYDDEKELFMQLAVIYVGLDSQSHNFNGTTSEEYIEIIYERLNEALKERFGIETNQDEFLDFITIVGELPKDKDPFEALTEAYRVYLEAIKIQLKENPHGPIEVKPVKDALAKAFEINQGR